MPLDDSDDRRYEVRPQQYPLPGPRCSRAPRGARQTSAVQKIVPAGESVDTYLADPQAVVTQEHLICPWCTASHRLRRHGTYRRTSILLGCRTLVVPVVRLLCPHARTTVSLLPDFCLPGRQHGPVVLGVFLEALVLLGLTLAKAMRRARPDAPAGHSLPQSLLAGFRRRLPVIRAWLASQRPRAPSAPQDSGRWSVELRAAVQCLLGFSSDPGAAFTAAGLQFHRCHGVGLA